MDINERIFNLLQQTGLNWTVQKETLISREDNAPTTAFGIFKKLDRTFLATVGDRYVPFQNSQLAESLLTATDSLGMPVTSGGQLSGGRKVFLQAELPDAFIGRSGVKRHITAINSHDGSTQIGFGSSNTVVICQNTFYRAYKDLARVRHTMTAQERVKALATELNQALVNDNRLIETFKIMADTKLEESLVEKVVRKIFNVDPSEKQEDITTRTKNKLITFSNALETELKLEGATVWGLFNGITRFTNHVVSPKNGDQLEYLMTGGGYELSNTTYDILCEELGITQLV